jgi:hypothetical protein
MATHCHGLSVVQYFPTKFKQLAHRAPPAWKFPVFKPIDNSLIRVILIYVAFNCLRGRNFSGPTRHLK